MSTTQRPTPETDAQCYDCEYQGDMGGKFTASAGKLRADGDHVPADFARKLERERDEAREELENLKASGIHSCHDACKRPLCVANRKMKAMREAIKKAHEAIKLLRDAAPCPHPQEHPSLFAASKVADDTMRKLQPFLKP